MSWRSFWQEFRDGLAGTSWTINQRDIARLRRIVYDLAAVSEVEIVEAGVCSLCLAPGFAVDVHWQGGDHAHMPDCPWKQAVDYVHKRRH